MTRLLHEVEAGNRAALNDLFPLVYDELRGMARYQRRRWIGDETLGTTALVHEAYLKLVGQERVSARSRAHFVAVAARAMRQILCNHARARRRLKRGGERRQLPLEALEALPAPAAISDAHADTLAALDSALTRLEAVDERLSRVIEYRFFGGMSIADAAVVLGTSPATVKRDWALARAWLFREIEREAGHG